MKPDRQLLFENGARFFGSAFGAANDCIADAIFHTAMVGYQEILSNPAGYGRMVVMTYPLIGNYGLTDDDYESKMPRISGLVVREYNDLPSNYRYTRTLSDVMQEYRIPGISGVDTRQITQMLRTQGAMRALITDAAVSVDKALSLLRETPVKRNHVAEVSCKKLWYARTENFRYHVVAIDCGIQQSMIRRLHQNGCNVAVVPHDITPSQIASLRPDGLFLSDGPGNPADAYAAMHVPALCKLGVPVFGIGLGCQLIALAHGAQLERMTSGHFGDNYPVQTVPSGDTNITSQAHLYTICKENIDCHSLSISHVNLLDGTVEGIVSRVYPAIGTQFMPDEQSPRGNGAVIDTFVAMMKAFRETGGDSNA